MNIETHRELVIIVSAIMVLALFPPTIHSAETEAEKVSCSGKFNGAQPTPQQLREVIESHKEWINLEDSTLVDDVRRANLCGADLSGADLSGADLKGADLSEAVLRNTNLSNVNLGKADLSKANLSRTNLSNAFLRSANLSEAKFEALAGTLPDGPRWVDAVGLSTMKYQKSQYALRELREIFKQAGQRQQEREITYAIKRSEAEKSGLILRGLSFVFFDLPCQYALSPLRPLLILFWGIFVFAVPYTIALVMKAGNSRGAIWRVWSSDRLADPIDNGASEREMLGGFTLLNGFRIGLYFSLLSAFHFGWRDLNVGNWIARLQPSEYALRSTGWVRTVSGVQSLLSVYLLALWALSNFGRPFE